VILKIILKAGYETKGKPEQKFDAVFGTILEIVFSKKQAKTLK
jgi:hypothetical protein